VVDGLISPGEYADPGFRYDFTTALNPGILANYSGVLLPFQSTKTLADLGVTLFTAFTATTWYAAFNVSDNFIDAERGNGATPMFNDCITLIPDGLLGTPSGFALLADTLGEQVTTVANDRFGNGDWATASTRIARGYLVEFGVPLRLIDTGAGPGVNPPAAGGSLYLNVAIVDNDRQLFNGQDAVGCLWANSTTRARPASQSDPSGFRVPVYLTPCTPGRSFQPQAPANLTCVPLRNCSVGAWVAVPATPTSDRGCQACAPGTFTAATNAALCAAWRVCPAGQYVTANGSATADRACGACVAGANFSRDADSDTCTPVAPPCAANETQTAAPTATSDRVCALVTSTSTPSAASTAATSTTVITTPVTTVTSSSSTTTPALTTTTATLASTSASPATTATTPPSTPSTTMPAPTSTATAPPTTTTPAARRHATASKDIASIVAAVCATLVVVFVLILLMWRYRRQQRLDSASDAADADAAKGAKTPLLLKNPAYASTGTPAGSAHHPCVHGRPDADAVVGRLQRRQRRASQRPVRNARDGGPRRAGVGHTRHIRPVAGQWPPPKRWIRPRGRRGRARLRHRRIIGCFIGCAGRRVFLDYTGR
jgi:hypothetical protein